MKTDGGFMPTPFARSHWGDDHLNCPATASAPSLPE
jgi:hypothetical protein